MEWIFGIALLGTLAYAISTRQKLERYISNYSPDASWSCLIDVHEAVADHPMFKEVTGVASLRQKKMSPTDKKRWESKWSQQFSDKSYVSIDYLAALSVYAVSYRNEGVNAVRYLVPRGTNPVYSEVVLGDDNFFRRNTLVLVVAQKFDSGRSLLEVSLDYIDSKSERTSTPLGLIPVTYAVSNEEMESLGFEVDRDEDYLLEGIEYSKDGLKVTVR